MNRTHLIALCLVCILGCAQEGAISGGVEPEVAQDAVAGAIVAPLSLSPSACDAAAAVAQSAAEVAKEAARRVRRYCAQYPSASACTQSIDRVEPAQVALTAANAEMIRICTDADEIPGGSHCIAARSWSSGARQLELDLITLLNRTRATATACGSRVMPPAPALTMDSSLRCAARLHSADMTARRYFAHTTPEGTTFLDRIAASGYQSLMASETIAQGQTTAQAVLDAWLSSPSQCEVLVSASFSEVGIGHADTGRHWTVKLAHPSATPAPAPVDPCAVTASWSSTAAKLEAQVLQEINARRATGAVCGTRSMARALPLTAAPRLTCAARYHAQNMASGGFFAHTTPWGETYFDRLDLVDYDYSFAGQVLGSGFTTAAAAVRGWMASASHCEQLMNPAVSELGAGYTASGHLWAIALGQPQ